MADLADEHRLLEALAIALRPDASAEPSMAELLALRAVVDEVQAGAARHPRPRRSLLSRRWIAGVVAGAVVLSGGTAYATNPDAPRPVRAAAHVLKLPVEAPDLTDAKGALDDLEEALGRGRRDRVAAAVDDVRAELADLSSEARRSLEPRASELLGAAEAFLVGPPAEDHEDDDVDGVDVEGRESSGSNDEGDSRDPSGSGGSGTSGSGSDDVDLEDLDDLDNVEDTSDRGSGGTTTSGSGSDDIDLDDLDDSSGSGSSGSGSGSSD